ncbi:oxidoreductase [Haladaptatus sp. R4]|uniref:Gfo/Idh/MocA family protein n=1 Tax=Haladaptatus sp. R4 TaxID=1679489 RepID=UPI0007B4D4A2|nr:Gfo/Idh/MocA family oxidoreductase [Haladaptatus sp. R4]KZN23161.1 oxidoreductase [Haladaptatus sp. R4]
MNRVNVGLLGCGTISDTYLRSDETFDIYDVTACADIDLELAEDKAAEYDVTAYDVEGLLQDPGIELVVNLTPPSVHAQTCRQILRAGKHVYVEKPLATSIDEVAEIRQIADENEVLVGSAPDTFLGAGLQTCRTVIDEGRIGEPIGATAIWTSPGHERWHPNPDLFYQRGGGPLFDMGPYYVTALVALLGPAARVSGSVTQGFEERTITSNPRRGEQLTVEVPTHETGIVDFENGAVANLLFSFDVQGSTLPEPTFEIYGTEGTLSLPDPNHFKGPVKIRERNKEEFKTIPLTHSYTDGRGAGVADLAYTLRTDWNQRTNVEVASHVFDILAGIRTSSKKNRHQDIDTDCERPALLPQSFPEEIRE